MMHGHTDIKCVTNSCAYVQFRVQRFGKSYIILSMNKDSTLQYSNGPVTIRKFKTLVNTCGERLEVGGVN